MNYFRFFTEILRGTRHNKSLPPFRKLMENFSRWVDYQNNHDVFVRKMPWITFAAIDYLEGYTKKDMKVFEFGGGGSSLFFASRAGELVTVEHDREWFSALREKVAHESDIKWNGVLIEAESNDIGDNLDISDPNHFYSDDKNFVGRIFRKYATFINQFPDEHFDIVLVDGRARPSCLKQSLKKVKRNGLLILDNADRDYYLKSFDGSFKDYELACDVFGPTAYSELFTQTNIWKRIK